MLTSVLVTALGLAVGAATTIYELGKAKAAKALADERERTIKTIQAAFEETLKAKQTELEAAKATLQSSEDLRHEQANRTTIALADKDKILAHYRSLLNELATRIPGVGGDRLDAAGRLLPLESNPMPNNPATTDNSATGTVHHKADPDHP